MKNIGPLPSILDVKCWCDNCGWQGIIWDCEPIVDGDGTIGCPKCSNIVLFNREGGCNQ